MRPLLRLAGVLQLLAVQLAAGEQGVPTTLTPFITTYCTECHDHDLAKGGLDLTSISYGADPAVHTRWVRIFDRVTAGEMPPPKKPRPETGQLSAFLGALERDLTAQHRAQRSTVLRRLNRSEYHHTIEDLLGMQVPQYEELPEDARSHGFDTNGEALGLSTVHLQRYLAAADLVLASLQLRASPLPSTTRMLSYADTGGGQRAIKENMWLKRDDGTVVLFSAGAFPSTIVDNLKISDGGTYRIRLRGRAWQSDKPMTIALWIGNFRSADNRLDGYFRLPADVPGTIELTAWLRPGDTIRPLVEGLSLPQEVKTGGPAALAAYKGRGLAVQAIEIEGPLQAQQPLRGQRLLFGALPLKAVPPAKGKAAGAPEVISADPQRDGARLLLGFAQTAFRHPINEAQAAPYVALMRDQLAHGATFTQAMLAAASAVLCAPDFLFLVERTHGPGERLDDFSIAARLSYMLSRSAPDDELLRAADAHRTPCAGRSPAGADGSAALHRRLHRRLARSAQYRCHHPGSEALSGIR